MEHLSCLQILDKVLTLVRDKLDGWQIVALAAVVVLGAWVAPSPLHKLWARLTARFAPPAKKKGTTAKK